MTDLNPEQVRRLAESFPHGGPVQQLAESWLAQREALVAHHEFGPGPQDDADCPVCGASRSNSAATPSG